MLRKMVECVSCITLIWRSWQFISVTNECVPSMYADIPSNHFRLPNQASDNYILLGAVSKRRVFICLALICAHVTKVTTH